MEKFSTFTEYINKNQITPNEEDYIEMMYRLKTEKITNSLLSNKLNVKPASITKMINKLTLKNIITKKNKGEIELTDYGKQLGIYYIERHKIVEELLLNIGIKENLLFYTEVIEHTLDHKLTEKFKNLNNLFKTTPGLKEYYVNLDV